MTPGEPAAERDAVLEFDDVSMRFDDTVALDRISMRMEPGATRIVLGAAGSGKSTLLKCALGLEHPDSGHILVFGQDITQMTEQQLFEVRRRMGVLFQEGGLFDSLTVADNVAYPLLHQGTGKPDYNIIDRKVEEALKFVDLENILDRFPSELSGGMRRRVGIARAVVTEPPLVLYDSPTAGLDPITANTIMALIAKERDVANTANLIVTHRYQDGELMANFRYNPESGRLEHASKNAAGSAATVFMVMEEGKLVFEGTLSELESSKNEYVRKFAPKH